MKGLGFKGRRATDVRTEAEPGWSSTCWRRSRLGRLLMRPEPHSDLIYSDATVKASKSPIIFGP